MGIRAQAALIPSQPEPVTYLLASLISAIAMRILFRRKISSKMIITSIMLRIITARGRECLSLSAA